MDDQSKTTDIVDRLREWSAADLDTHAVIRRNGEWVGEMPWVKHATDLHADLAQAAAEIERLRALTPGYSLAGCAPVEITGRSTVI